MQNEKCHFYKFQYFLKSRLLSINYIHNQFQNIQWISSKVLEWTFIYFFRFFLGQNLLKNDISIHRICPQSGLKHSVVHFKGIGMKIIIFFEKKYFCQNMFKKLISIHKLCPQSVLKHSVDHFQRYWNEHFIFFFKIIFFKFEHVLQWAF